MSFRKRIAEEMKKLTDTSFMEVAPPGKEDMVKALKKDPDVDNPYAVAWAAHNKGESVGEDEGEVTLSRAELDPHDMSLDDLKHMVQQARGTEHYDELHQLWLERMYAEKGGHGPTVGPDAPMTMEDIDLEGVLGEESKKKTEVCYQSWDDVDDEEAEKVYKKEKTDEAELATSPGDAGPNKKWSPSFEKQPDDAGAPEWHEPKADWSTIKHRDSLRGVVKMGTQPDMENKAYSKDGENNKPRIKTVSYDEAIRVEHPLKGRGTVVSLAEGVATVEWDRMDLRVGGPETFTKEQADEQFLTVVSERYAHDEEEAEMGPHAKKKKKDDKDKVDEDQYEQQPSFQVAPPPSMTIFQDQEPDDGKWKADPLSTKAGAESASDGEEVEGELEEPDDAPDPLNINDLGDPDSGRGESIAKKVFSSYDGEGGDNTEIDYDSDRVDYDRQEDSSHNKKDQDSEDSGEDREEDEDEGQDNQGREEENMKKRESRISGKDLGFDLYESDITLSDMDVEGILTEDARPHMQGMGGGSAGVRDDKHGKKGKDNPDSPLHMKEHELGQGEVAMTKELLVKLLAAVVGQNPGEEAMEDICMGLVNAANKEDRTLDVSDIGMIMGEIKAAHGAHDEGSEDDAALDQAMGSEEDYGDMGDDEVEEEETCEGCGEEGSYEDRAEGDMAEPKGGAEKHREGDKKQIMGSEDYDDGMTETEGSGTPISDQKSKGKGPGGGSADEKGQKPSDDIIPPTKKGSTRGSLGPVTDSNPLPPGGGEGGKPMTEAWLAAIPGTVRNLDGEPEIDDDDPDAELKMIKRRAGMPEWWKV